MKDITIEQLRENLHGESVVEFTFTKNDGTERKAVGTLNENLIPIEQHIINPGEKDVSINYANFRYFDLEKSGWRSLGKTTTTVKVK